MKHMGEGRVRSICTRIADNKIKLISP